MEIVLIIIAALAVGYILYAARAKKWPFASESTVGTKSRQQAIIETLKHKFEVHGAVVFSQAPLPNAVTDGIANAFFERIAAARVKGWQNGLDPHNYTIFVFPSVRDHDADGTYSPCFPVFIDAGDPYDNSIYDQEPNSPGGYIFAAEQVLMTGQIPQNKFIIAMNDKRDYSARVTSYALDHLFAWHNDRDLYNRTADHSRGSQHPLWG